MDKETRSWLIAVPFDADGNAPPRQRPVLSPRQKRELTVGSVLMIASTAFFLMPFLLSSTRQTAPTRQLTDTIATAATSSPTVEPTALTERPKTAVKRTKSAPRPRAGTLAGRKKSTRPDLLRAFVGNGRYRVQPFPTVAAGD